MQSYFDEKEKFQCRLKIFTKKALAILKISPFSVRLNVI